MFGKMVRDTRQGWAIFAAMSLMFLAGAFICYWAEQAGNPMLTKMGLEHVYTAGQPGGNMEGKEVRFGNPMTALFATVTTDASCGAVIGMHDSFTPIGGLVPLFNIQTDEVIFGGVGAGLYSMLIYAVVAVFIGGLMVGRTPEYVGKKIEQKEVKMAIIAILATSVVILGFTAISSVATVCEERVLESRQARLQRIRITRPRMDSLKFYTRIQAGLGIMAAPLRESTPTRPGTT